MKTKVCEAEQHHNCEDCMRLGDTVEVCNSEDDKYYNGDFGVIIDIKDDMYLVNFRNINATAWFNKYEIKSKE